MQTRIDTWREFSTSSDGGPSLGIAGTVLALVTFIALLHPHPLVLPLLSVILTVSGFVFAGIVAWRNRGSALPVLDKLHLPALIIFFGFAAAMLGDVDPAIQSIQKAR